MEDDEDFYEYENQPEFLAERDVFNRVGGVDIGLGLGGVINLKKSGYTSLEKFKLIAAATIKLLNEINDTEVLSDAGLTRMLGLVEKIPAYEFKNPSAFAMGFIIALNSKHLNINKEWLNKIIDLNKEIEDKIVKISDFDIVRYTRLCLLNKFK